jgi:hypothetical protein
MDETPVEWSVQAGPTVFCLNGGGLGMYLYLLNQLVGSGAVNLFAGGHGEAWVYTTEE